MTVVVALVAGLVVGAIAGAVARGAGRRCVPEVDLARERRALDEARHRAAELQRSLEVLEAIREQGKAEARRLRTAVERSRDERARLAARDERSRDEVAELTRQRDLLLREVVGLQRRVAELRVARDRGVDPEAARPGDDGVEVGATSGVITGTAVDGDDAVVLDLRDGRSPGAATVVDLRDGAERQADEVGHDPGGAQGGSPARRADPSPALNAD